MIEHLGIWIVVRLRQLEKINLISVDVAGKISNEIFLDKIM